MQGSHFALMRLLKKRHTGKEELTFYIENVLISKKLLVTGCQNKDDVMLLDF